MKVVFPVEYCPRSKTCKRRRGEKAVRFGMHESAAAALVMRLPLLRCRHSARRLSGLPAHACVWQTQPPSRRPHSPPQRSQQRRITITRAWGFPSKSASVSSGLKKAPNLYASSMGLTFALYTAVIISVRTVRALLSIAAAAVVRSAAALCAADHVRRSQERPERLQQPDRAQRSGETQVRCRHASPPRAHLLSARR